MWLKRGRDIAVSLIFSVAIAYVLNRTAHAPFWMVLEFSVPLAVVYVAARWRKTPLVGAMLTSPRAVAEVW